LKGKGDKGVEREVTRRDEALFLGGHLAAEELVMQPDLKKAGFCVLTGMMAYKGENCAMDRL
jgi:hypothetical protein